MLNSITVCKNTKANMIPVQCIDTEKSKTAFYFKCLMNSMTILLLNVIFITVKTISLHLH